ncbi:MAG: hypothetical protein ACJA1L_003806 [Paracoccaceae bacterium]|jgi:hypothetical protein
MRDELTEYRLRALVRDPDAAIKSPSQVDDRRADLHRRKRAGPPHRVTTGDMKIDAVRTLRPIAMIGAIHCTKDFVRASEAPNAYPLIYIRFDDGRRRGHGNAAQRKDRARRSRLGAPKGARIENGVPARSIEPGGRRSCRRAASRRQT